MIDQPPDFSNSNELLKLGGFPLRKFSANHPDILKDIPIDYLAINSKSFEDKELGTSVLSLSWNPIDNFLFKFIPFNQAFKLTKRFFLSRTAKLFDPMGWIGPIVIRAKILIQLLWQEKKGWDDEIDLKNQQIWLKWESELPFIQQLKLPRWTGYNPQAQIIEVHGFGDASKLVYGVCVYLRVIAGNHVTVKLVFAKSKVAPLKQLSIPRLELSAAQLLAK